MSPRRLRWPALLTVAVMALAGCDDGRDVPVTASTTTTVAVTTAAKSLAGLIGTAPRVDMSDALRRRIDQLDGGGDVAVSDAARPYDAVIVAALAAEVARTDSPSRIAANIRDVTHDGHSCFDYKACRDLTDAGTDVDYDGPSGDIDLLGDGQSGDGTFAVMQVSPTGALTQIAAESADVVPPAQTIALPDPATGPRADGRLVIGMVLPTAGPQAAVAAAARAGIRVAIDEVNSSGGALDRPVQLVFGDAGDGSAAQVQAAAAVVLGASADVVIGGLDRADTAQLVDAVTGAGVVFMSVGVPSIVDSPLARSGLFFRMTPPVAVQARALAAAVADDGQTSAVVIHSTDADGATMSEQFSSGFSAVDATVASTIGVGPDQPVGPIVDLALATHPSSVVIMADQAVSAALLAELRSRGQGPDVLPTFVANIGPALLAAAS